MGSGGKSGGVVGPCEFGSGLGRGSSRKPEFGMGAISGDVMRSSAGDKGLAGLAASGGGPT